MVHQDNSNTREQAGFRKGFQTVHNIFIIDTTIIKHMFQKGGRMYAAFTDLKAAFDSIYRNGLLFKL